MLNLELRDAKKRLGMFAASIVGVVGLIFGIVVTPALADEPPAPDPRTTCPVPGQMPNGPGGANGRDDNVSLFVGGDLKVAPGAGEAEGVNVVVGDASYENSGTFDIGAVGTGSGITPSPMSTVLRVGGNLSIADGTNLDVGTFGGVTDPLGTGVSVKVGGTVDGAERLENGTGTPLSKKVLAQEVGWGRALEPFQRLSYQLAKLSSTLAGYGTNGTFSSGTFKGNGEDGALQVFKISPADLTGVDSFSFTNVGDASTPILINVPGKSVKITARETLSTGAHGFGNWSSRILYNFYEATSLTIAGDDDVLGSILAPKANAEIQASTNGRLLIGGSLALGGGSNGFRQEHHNYPWIGDPLTQCWANESPELTPPPPPPPPTSPETKTGELSITSTLSGDVSVSDDWNPDVTYGATWDGGPKNGARVAVKFGQTAKFMDPKDPSKALALPDGTKVTIALVDPRPAGPDERAWQTIQFKVGDATTENQGVATIEADKTLAVQATATFAPRPAERGRISIQKALSDNVQVSDAWNPDFTFVATWDGGPKHGAELTLKAGESKVFADPEDPKQDLELRVGTRVLIREETLSPASGPAGETWNRVSFTVNDLSSDSKTLVAIAANQTVSVTATNIYDVAEPDISYGTIQMSAALDGIDAMRFPNGTNFDVTVSWEQEGVGRQSTVLRLPVTGEPIPLGVSLPEGTPLTFSQTRAPTVSDFRWDGASFTPKTVVIVGAENPTVTVTNHFESTLPDSGHSGAFWIIVVGLILAGLGALVMYLRRRSDASKKTDGTADSDSDDASDAEEPADPGSAESEDDPQDVG